MAKRKKKRSKKSKWMQLVKKYGVQKAAKKYKGGKKRKKTTRKSPRKKVAKMPVDGIYRSVLPDNRFTKASFRWIKLGKGIWGRVGCPKGTWSPTAMYQGKVGKCLSSMILNEVVFPKKTRKRDIDRMLKKFRSQARKALRRHATGGSMVANPKTHYTEADRQKWLGKTRPNFAKRMGKYSKDELEEMIKALGSYPEQTPSILAELQALYKQYEKKHGKKATASLVKDVARLSKGAMRANPELFIGNPSKLTKKTKIVRRSKKKWKTSRRAWNDIKKKTGIPAWAAKPMHTKKYFQWYVPATYAANPSDINAKKLKAAEKMYRKLHGADPMEIIEVEVPESMAGEVLVSMGQAPDETYRPPKHSKKAGATYLHRYEEEPHKAVTSDGSLVLTVGGNYKVGSRGIEG